MKGRVIALDHHDGAEAAALMVDGRLEDLYIDTDLPRPGTIYRAIAERPVKGQGGMFVQTPDGTAFLRQVKGLAPGQPILVQVTGYAEPGKAIPVTAKLLFKSRYVIVTPGAPGVNVSRSIRDEQERDRLLELAHDAGGAGGHGVILRSSCEGVVDEELVDDLHQTALLAQQVLADAEARHPDVLSEGDGPHLLAWREWTQPADVDTSAGSFEVLGVLDALDALASPEVALSGGGSCWIEPTRALVAVDVNTGGDTSPAAGIKANLAMARDLPRQLRLRGLGGQIVLDLAPMAKKDRRQFESALRGALKTDGVETAMVGWTPLGHYELQRKKDRLPHG